MRRGPIPLNAHAALEPLMAVLIIASPWIFGFSDVSEAKTICIIVGAVMLLAGSLTRWRFSLVKLIPLRTHFATDLLLGALLILSPFIFGFSDQGGATRFMIIVGALELLTALGTRWESHEAVLTVDDDGAGFDPEQRLGSGHFGLANLRDRSTAVAGELTIDTEEGRGTRIIVRLPLAPSEALS